MIKVLLTLSLIVLIGCRSNTVNYGMSNFEVNGPLIDKGLDYHIILSGAFDDTSYIKLKNKLDLYKDRKVYIHAKSNGGLFNDRNSIINLMELVHSYDNIVWISKGRCYSACAIIGASSKSVHGILSFHAVSRASYTKTGFMVTNEIIDKEYSEKILNLLVEYGNDRELLQAALSNKELIKINFNRESKY